jgi:hypothetical protein
MKKTQTILFDNNNSTWVSNYAERPSKLFYGADVLLTIFICCKNGGKRKYTTGFTKWRTTEREILFTKFQYYIANVKLKDYIEPKISSDSENDILIKNLLLSSWLTA